MKEIFLTVAEISLATSVIVLGLLLVSRGLNKRYLAKWKYFIWIALALRLAVPVKLELPQKEIVFEVPARMAAPIAAAPVDLGNAIPFAPQTVLAPSVSALDVISAVWLVGCALFLLVHFGSYFAYRRRVVVGGEPLRDRDTLCLVRGLARELGITYHIPVRTCAAASSPMVLGFFRPILVLPAMDYREGELPFVLRHELIHLKRHDIFVKLLFIVANAIHWFNPVVYIMRKQAVVDMELSCDETVVQGHGYDTRKAYTETLLSTLCRQQTKATGLSTQFYGGKDVMKLRFTNLLSRGKKKNGRIVFLVVVAIIAVFGTVIGFTTGDPQDPTPTGDDITWASLDFGEAFGMGNRESMATFLDKTYEGEMEVYPFPERELADDGYLFNTVEDIPKFGDISNHRIFWPSTFSKSVPLGSTYTVKVREGDKPDGDHLILSLINREDGWKVRDYEFFRGTDADTVMEETQGANPELNDLKAALGVSYQFSEACLRGDTAAMKPLMADSFRGTLQTYQSSDFSVSNPLPDGIMNHRIYGLISSEPDNIYQPNVSVGCLLKLGMKLNTDGDELILSLVKQEDGWKVSEYELGHRAVEETQTNTEEEPYDKEIMAMYETLDQFARAYLGGDLETMESLAAYSYVEIESYQGPAVDVAHSSFHLSFAPTPYDLSIDPNAELSIYSRNIPQGSRITMVAEIPGASAGVDRLVVTLAKTAEGWKVADYGFARRGITATEEDCRQLAEITEKFASAYFAGDDKTLDAYVLQPRDQFSSGAYTGELLEIHAFKGLPRPGDTLPENGQIPVSVEFLEAESPDSYTYLSIEFLKQGTEWKINSYGLEK